MVHRGDATHPALVTLLYAANELARNEGWGKAADGAWLPSADAGWSSSPRPVAASPPGSQ